MGTIPLTIKHTKKDLPFFQMPAVRLGILLDIEFEKAFKKEILIVEDWIKNKRCKCAEHPNIQNKILSLGCKHIEKRLDEDKELIESWSKIRRMSSASILRNLHKGMMKIKRSADFR